MSAATSGAPVAPGSVVAQPKGLRRGAINTIEVIGQAVGAVSPTPTIAVLVAGIIVVGGNASWLANILATLLILCVAVCIAGLTRRFNTSGGLYQLVGKAGGKFPGYVTAILYVIIYMLNTAAILLALEIYAGAFLGRLGLGSSPLLSLICGGVGLGLVVFLATRAILISARVLLWLEVCGVTTITAGLIIVLAAHPDRIIDSAQFQLHGSTLHIILLATVLATGNFGGFDGTAVFGHEAKDRYRSIPRALIGSVLLLGAMLILATYVTVLGFRGIPGGVASSGAPLDTMVTNAGVAWYGWIVDFIVAIAALAGTLANVNICSRVIYTLSEERLLPRRLGRLHRQHQTPVDAIVVVVVSALAVIAFVAITGSNKLNAVIDIVTFTGSALLVLYAITCIVTPMLQFREGRVWIPWAVVGLIGTAGMVYALDSAWNPLPAYPLNVVIYILWAVLAVVLASYVVMRIWRPDVLDLIGSKVEEAGSSYPGEDERIAVSNA